MLTFHNDPEINASASASISIAYKDDTDAAIAANAARGAIGGADAAITYGAAYEAAFIAQSEKLLELLGNA